MLPRILIYFFAFALPPVMLGTVFAFSALSEIMIGKKPPALGAEQFPPPRPIGKKPKALIVLGEQGTQITDLMGPYEILSESGIFDVRTVAPERILLRTTGAVAVLPDFTFKDAPKPDLLVIPALIGDPSTPDYASTIEWIRKVAPGARLVLSVCEGSRVAAQAGLLKGRKATSHFLALPDLKAAYPDTKWISDERTVLDGKIVSSAGVSASLDAAYRAVELFGGPKPPRENVGSYRSARLGARDFFELFLYGGYGWGKPQIAVAVFPGVSEISLAAALDTFPRSLYAHVSTVAAEQKPIQTAHGLSLLPTRTIREMPEMQILYIPTADSSDAEFESTLRDLQKTQTLELVDLRRVPSSESFDRSLQLIAQNFYPAAETYPGLKMSRVIARLIEYPFTEQPVQKVPGPFANFYFWYRPLLIGVLGILVARIFERRIMKRKPSST